VQPDPGLCDGLENQAIAVDVPAVHVRVAVVVGHDGTVFTVLGCPAGHLVKLPLEDEGAIVKELLLVAAQGNRLPPAGRYRTGHEDTVQARGQLATTPISTTPSTTSPAIA
jgi:hypothetical protein